MAIIWKDKDGKKHGRDCSANTEPSAHHEQREKQKVVKSNSRRASSRGRTASATSGSGAPAATPSNPDT